tara:strand:- start:886 stop:1089 length:204 start_codon:yes stop_codon:yes gene_type:complete
MKVGDLIRDKRWREDGYAVIVAIDLSSNEPYWVYCCYLEAMQWFKKYYIEQECEVVNESRGFSKIEG